MTWKSVQKRWVSDLPPAGRVLLVQNHPLFLLTSHRIISPFEAQSSYPASVAKSEIKASDLSWQITSEAPFTNEDSPLKNLRWLRFSEMDLESSPLPKVLII